MKQYQPERAVEVVSPGLSSEKTAKVRRSETEKKNLRKRVGINESVTSIREYSTGDFSKSDEDTFDLDQWIKDVARYSLFLLVFTVFIFIGRGSEQAAAYVSKWKSLLNNRTLNTRSESI